MQADATHKDNSSGFLILVGVAIFGIVLAGGFVDAQTGTDSGLSPYTASTRVTVKGIVTAAPLRHPEPLTRRETLPGTQLFQAEPLPRVATPLPVVSISPQCK